MHNFCNVASKVFSVEIIILILEPWIIFRHKNLYLLGWEQVLMQTNPLLCPELTTHFNRYYTSLVQRCTTQRPFYLLSLIYFRFDDVRTDL